MVTKTFQMVLGCIFLEFPSVFHQMSLSSVSIKFLMWILPYFVHPLNHSACSALHFLHCRLPWWWPSLTWLRTLWAATTSTCSSPLVSLAQGCMEGKTLPALDTSSPCSGQHSRAPTVLKDSILQQLDWKPIGFFPFKTSGYTCMLRVATIEARFHYGNVAISMESVEMEAEPKGEIRVA